VQEIRGSPEEYFYPDLPRDINFHVQLPSQTQDGSIAADARTKKNPASRVCTSSRRRREKSARRIPTRRKKSSDYKPRLHAAGQIVSA